MFELRSLRERGLSVILSSLLVAGGAGLAGYCFYREESEHAREQVQNELSAAATIKAEQIAAWRRERIADAQVAAANWLVSRAISRFLNGSPSAGLSHDITAWLRTVKQSNGYENVLLLDSGGRVRLAASEASPVVGRQSLALAVESIRTGLVLLSDLHRDEDFPRVHLDLLAPIMHDCGAHPVGTLLLRADTELFPGLHIPSWPAPNRSAQTMLVRQDGNQMVILNELRRQKTAALATALLVIAGGASVALLLRQQACCAARRKEAAQMQRKRAEQVIEAQEEERRRIAQELHDETAQSLTSVLVGLRNLRDSATLAQARQRASQLCELVRAAIDEVRRLVRRLHPRALEELGFPAAVERYVADFIDAHGIPVDLQVGGLDSLPPLPPAVATALYRIMQESLTNAARHAAASAISVVIQRCDAHALTIIEDNGKGFPAEASAPGSLEERGLGLYGIRQRAAVLGGSVTIESTPGGGTTLRVRIPLNQAGDD